MIVRSYHNYRIDFDKNKNEISMFQYDSSRDEDDIILITGDQFNTFLSDLQTVYQELISQKAN